MPPFFAILFSRSAVFQFCEHLRRNLGNEIVHSSRDASFSVAIQHRGEYVLNCTNALPIKSPFYPHIFNFNCLRGDGKPRIFAYSYCRQLTWHANPYLKLYHRL